MMMSDLKMAMNNISDLNLILAGCFFFNCIKIIFNRSLLFRLHLKFSNRLLNYLLLRLSFMERPTRKNNTYGREYN